jgi:hypothetical protein
MSTYRRHLDGVLSWTEGLWQLRVDSRAFDDDSCGNDTSTAIARINFTT